MASTRSCPYTLNWPRASSVTGNPDNGSLHVSRGKSKSSDRWLNEHASDLYVQKAMADGYRSRAVYKLIELDQKDGLIRRGATVLELGAAPGGWTQYIAENVGDAGKVVASDILPMDSVANVTFIEGDFTENRVADAIEKALGPSGADLVLSDMAPNISGVSATDQARAMGLVELALDMAAQVLNENGAFAVKVFQGEGFDAFVKDVRSRFKTVKLRKPSASRSRSREIYVVARNLIS